MSDSSKRETIYIDIEDDVTSIVDKVRSASAKVVALVVPKRSTTLQSAVNVKLIKRAAISSKKAVVLITSDEGMRALAASVGIHVAKTLQSKPEIPALTDEIDTDIDGDTPVGDLAKKDDIEIDNSENAPKAEAAVPKGAKKGAVLAALKSSKIKIPNFEKFRTKLLIGGGLLVVLIGGWIWASIFLPRAEIIITTNTSVIDTETVFSAKTDATEFDAENKVVPAYVNEVEKIDSESVEATGSRDEGTKAKGTLTLTNCIDDSESKTIPAGTGFSTSEGLTYVTNQSVTLSASYYADGECKTEFGTTLGFMKDIGVTAIEGGEKFNIKAQGYTAPEAYQTANGSIQAEGSKMSGGTTKIVKFVSQNDIEAAKQAVTDDVEPKAKEELSSQFSSDQAYALGDTFEAGDAEVTSVPKVGEEVKDGNQAKVTVKIIYKQTGIKKEYLTKLIEAAAEGSVDSSTQVIQNTGLDEAEITITDEPSDSETRIRMLSTVVAGPQLDETSIKESVAGEKKARTREIIQQRPGITGVEVNYSPFWVTNTPDNPEKVTVTFQQANGN